MNKPIPLPPLLILCAGSSTRMGQPKGLVKIFAETLLEYQIKNYTSVGLEKIIVVLGAHINQYIAQLPWIGRAMKSWLNYESNSVKVIENIHHELGQFSSLQAGLNEFLKLRENFIFILPIDVPLPDESVLYRILSVFNKDLWVTTPELFGRGGHPVLINRDFATHLVSLDPQHTDSRLDKQIELLDSSKKTRIGVTDPGIHLNINNEEHLQRFLDNLKS